MEFKEGQTVGIDLGTTFSAIAHLDAEGNPVKPVDLGFKCEKCGAPMHVKRGKMKEAITPGRQPC